MGTQNKKRREIRMVKTKDLVKKTHDVLAAGLFGIVLGTSQVSAEHKPVCSEPLPEITESSFGMKLYQKAESCDKGIIARVDAYTDNGTRIVFMDEGVRYTLQISPTYLDVHFREDGTSGYHSRGFIADSAEGEFRSSNKLDSICENVALYDGNNGIFTEDIVPKEVRFNHSSLLFSYSSSRKEKTSAKETYFAQEVCSDVLNRIRDFYNNNLE